MTDTPKININYSKYHKPSIAWPTVMLFLSAGLFSLLSILLGSGYIIPFDLVAGGLSNLLSLFSLDISASICRYFVVIPIRIISLIISSACAYAQFTVAHDAIHGAIAKNRKLNNFVGFLSQLWLGPSSSWEGLAFSHRRHHAYTNDLERDPDMWASLDGPGGPYLVPLRWMSVDISYLRHYLPYLLKQNFKEILNFIAYEFAMISFVYLLVQYGFLWPLVQYWIVPSRIAIIILAIAFDFAPHHLGGTLSKDDKFRSTSYITTHWTLRPILQIITFNQMHHWCHHANTKPAFYQYHLIWHDYKDELLNLDGFRVIEIFKQLGNDELAQSPQQSPSVSRLSKTN